MKLTFLRLNNFLSFKNLEHVFVDKPVLVQGKNLTEIESKETNGSGKSTIMAGIAYAILATSLRKQTLDRDLITWGEEEADIWLNIYCHIRKKTLNIHRTLRQKGSSSLELTLDNVSGSVQTATVNDGNAYILNWIGISSEDIKNYFIINKENFKSFISSSNSDKLSLISRFIKVDCLDGVDNMIKEKNQPLEQKLEQHKLEASKIEGELSVYEKQLVEEMERNLEEELQEKIRNIQNDIDKKLKEFELSSKNVEEDEYSIKLLKKEIVDINRKLLRVNEDIDRFEKINFQDKMTTVNIEVSKLTDKDGEVRKKRANYLDLNSKFRSEIENMNLILAGVIECPNCHYEFSVSKKNIDISDIRNLIIKNESIIDYNQIIIEDTLLELKTLESKIIKCNEKIQQLRIEEKTQIAEFGKFQETINHLRFEIQRCDHSISEASLRISSNIEKQIFIEKDCDELDKLLTKVYQEKIESKEEELQGVVTVIKKKLEKKKIDQENTQKKIIENTQWVLRFKEFKMSLACNQLRVIQNFANLALQRQNSELRLSIDGFKIDAKGKIKSEITVSVINGCGEFKSFWSFSGGERARIEIALIQSFQEMINATNSYGGLQFLAIDEVLEGVDPIGLSLLLESLSETSFPVYIISHVMNLRAGANVLTVIKENGYSYIE